MTVKLLFVLSLILLGVRIAAAQESVWMSNISGEASTDSLTPQQARERIKADVYAAALRQLGIEIKAEQFTVQSEAAGSSVLQRKANDAFLNVVRAGSQGFVTGLRNVRWQTEDIQKDPNRAPTVRYRGTMDVKVTRPKGERDEEFTVALKLNQRTVREGEKVVLQFTPSRDCYLYLFNVAGDSVRLLFPHPYAEDNRAAARQTVVFPPPLMAWRAFLPEGWESSEELLLVVATKTNQTTQRVVGTVDREGYLSTREAALMEVMEWISGMPPGEGAVGIERLEIVRK